jgi:DNA primase
MNVKVCSFPDGEDPDSFAKNNSYDVLKNYLDENSKDFIQFKADLLVKEANNDPIKKAELIRDMVQSISKISDQIKREVYIKECSRIMDISEDVLYNTLAQMLKKDISEANKKYTEEKKAFEVHKNNVQLQPEKIDILYELEQKIIEILLINGSKTDDFTETFLSKDETGNIVEVKETNSYKVYEKIYLALQEDEIELSNPIFKTIYSDIINYYNQNIEFEIDKYISQTSPEIANKITSILMLEERDVLHKWESRKIVVEDKNINLAQSVNETILSYRWYLLNSIIEENKNKITTDISIDNSEILTTIKDYISLTSVIAKNLGRVLARF